MASSAAVRTVPSLKRNFSWTFVGNSTYAATQGILLVVLARMGTQADVGHFALATAISAPIISFSNLKLRSVQASDALDEYPFGTYLTLRLLTSALALLVVTGFILASGYRGTVAWVILLMAAAKTIESVSDVFYGMQQRHEEMATIAWSMIIKGCLSVAAFSGALWYTGSLVSGVLGLSIAWLLTLLCFDIPRARKLSGAGGIGPTWNLGSSLRLAALALPLGATVAIGSLFTNVPRYFIEALLSTEELGVFAAVSYLMVAGSLVIAAIGQSATPRLARLYRTGNQRGHLVLTLKLLVLGAGVGVLGILAVVALGEPILRIAYGTSYANHNDLFIWLMMSGAVGYSYVFLGTALTSMKKFNVQLPIHVVGLVGLVVSCWVLVPRYGLVGAGAAMFAANVLQAGLYSIMFKREISLPPPTSGGSVTP